MKMPRGILKAGNKGLNPEALVEIYIHRLEAES